MKPKFPRGTLDRLWADPKHWNAGIYSCKEDPRVVVPKRIRWAGWTVNFAHARTWPVLLGVIFVAIAPMLWFAWVGAASAPVWFAETYFGFVAVLAVVLIAISPYFASPKRYED